MDGEKGMHSQMIQHEDELPSDLSQAEYDRWYDQSEIVDGVRMGPPLKRITYSLESLYHFKCGDCLGWVVNRRLETGSRAHVPALLSEAGGRGNFHQFRL